MRSAIRNTRRFRGLCGLALGGALTTVGCSGRTTEPTPMAATLRVVNPPTQEERDAWPFTPTISGGTSILIRGTTLTPCNAADVRADRAGRALSVAIVPRDPPVPCAAIYSGNVLFEVTIDGLEPGPYLVTVTSFGLDGATRFQVYIRE